MSKWPHPLSIVYQHRLWSNWQRVVSILYRVLGVILITFGVILTPSVVHRCHFDTIRCQVENASVSFRQHSFSSWERIGVILTPFVVKLTIFFIIWLWFGIDSIWCRFDTIWYRFHNIWLSVREHVGVHSRPFAVKSPTAFFLQHNGIKLTTLVVKFDNVRCQKNWQRKNLTSAVNFERRFSLSV